MTFTKYPLDPISPMIQSGIDIHYKQIRDHSAMLVQQGINLETDRICDLLPSIAFSIMSEVLNAGMNYPDAYVVDENGINLEGRIANLIYDMLGY